MSIMRNVLLAGLLFPSAFLAAEVAEANVILTDSTVFSANSDGHYWLSWIWNTQGKPADGPDRWNLYYSSSNDPLNPLFINSGNDASTEIAIAMTPGVHDFVIFGERASDPSPHAADLHFVANLYFDGNQSDPGISGLYGPTCLVVCATSSANGLDLFGNAPQQLAGTLDYISGDITVSLTHFSWAVDDEVDRVWPHYAGAYNGNYSGTPDFVGRIQLTVTQQVAPIPIPAAWALLGTGLLLLGGLGRRRRN
jgi:hypothetical protein